MRHNPLGTTVKPGRDAFKQWSDLSNTHGILLLAPANQADIFSLSGLSNYTKLVVRNFRKAGSPQPESFFSTRQRIHSINVSDADFKWLGLKAHVCTASGSRYSMTFVLLTAPPSPDRNSLNTSADRIVSPPINTKA